MKSARHGERRSLNIERFVGPFAEKRDRREPQRDDDDRPDAAGARVDAPRLARAGAALREDFGRNHLDYEHDGEGQQHDVVEKADHRNEIRDEIDRGECVSDDRRDQRLRVPRRARMARGEVEGGDLGLELTRSRLEARDERHVAPMSEGGIVARSGFVFQCADAFAHTIMAHPLPALSLLETRVLGVLYEKEHTVPDTYPLTLNALVAGCNQKTSRDPVLEAADAEVQAAIDRLKSLTMVVESSGGRVIRYAHNAGKGLGLPPQ